MERSPPDTFADLITSRPPTPEPRPQEIIVTRTMKAHRPISTIALAVILAAAGCSSSGPDAAAPAEATPSAAATTTAAPRAADEYDSAQRLVGGVNAAGIACINWESIDEPIGAEERGSCFVGEEQIVASIFATSEDAAGEPASQAEVLAGVSDVVMVVGGNWTLGCDTRALCAQIEDKFGGKLVEIPA